MYDSPELALVAEQLGLGHPFGQPLHTLLGALAVRLPGLDPLIALNGLSALAGALTVIPATSLAETLVRPDPRCPPGDLRFISPAVALAGVHTALWEPSTRIEVYSLAVFFVLWAAARCSNALLDQDQRSRLYFSVGLAFGLAASANVVCAFGGAIAITPRLLIADFSQRDSAARARSADRRGTARARNIRLRVSRCRPGRCRGLGRTNGRRCDQTLLHRRRFQCQGCDLMG